MPIGTATKNLFGCVAVRGTVAWRLVAMVANAVLAGILLRNGANPNWRDANGDTLSIACLKAGWLSIQLNL